ncbi:MAG: trypsin-like peptidase domain-containing protein [Gaiellaceae bacterium MAG52_C11]|nr:trypsin-like peptidase domain-containing protein [Candidatus Gaiellasilicea maunaloa]
MKNPFKHPRAGAAALVAAVFLGAGGGAVAVSALDSGETVVRQVTVGRSAQQAASSTSTVGEIYERSAQSVVEIAVGGESGPQSQGSGFVYDDGHVITNQHVVAGASTVSVKFADGSTYEATVVGSDPSTDLAVLDVDAPASALQPLALADSGDVEVGDGVIAIGSPFGLDQTVTTGIVSALHRQINSPNDFAIDDAIQTDAAINHGNSGGPLLDLDGRVIGVNSQIESRSGGNDGVGFAVPSDTVARIAAELIADGKVEHAYLGVATEDATDGDGVRLAQVRPGTPAAAAGLRDGDMVTEIDGEPVDAADGLRRLIDARRPGDSVELTIVRSGDERTVEVELGARPAA